MNLHIAPDNTFINAFYGNLKEVSLLNNNRIVIRSNNKELEAVKHDIPFAPLYSKKFNLLVGDTFSYDKVYVHYFTPLLYRWVALNKFKELNWLPWGGDIYNLPSLDHLCYEPLTYMQYIKKNKSFGQILYELKVLIFNSAFKKRAYSKVANIMTWMEQEYQFALHHLPVQAKHKFFFYENQFPYSDLDSIQSSTTTRDRLSLIIGNSGSPTNNHLDTVSFLEKHKIGADLIVPVSYGDKNYISFLKKRLTYKYGALEFVDRYMQFHEYIRFLADADGLVMNTIRPQGYGNIFMMLYLNKAVFFNERNISLPDLTKNGINCLSFQDIVSFGQETPPENRGAVVNFLSHERLLTEYRQLFC
ncbi:MAG TPA: TDP-N-acetylfucosamine:lipid II N-acetylfucosaminyltransferase [Chryseolinea sp.]|nr:TDP-N-acetylfucosamine:lipid II N-acetylfucosaminyltransferase [Chryseolinea sp.]